MIKHYYLIALFLTTSLSFSQIYLEEHFENSSLFPPTNWEIKKIEGDESWKYESTEKAAYSDANTNEKQDAWLITPQLNITANAVLKFKVKADELVPPDNLYIKISETGKNIGDFTNTLKAIKVGKNVTKNYQNYIVDLKEYTGKSIYIGFHHKSEFAYKDINYGDTYYGASGFYLDDILVTSDLQKEVSIIQLLSPHQGDIIGEKTVSIILKNTGDIDIEANKIKVNYTYKEEATIEEIVGKGLKVGETITYEFSTHLNISEEGKNVKLKTKATVNGANNTNGNNERTNYITYYSNKSLHENFEGINFLPDGWASYYIKGPYADRLRKKDNTAFIKSTSTTEGTDMLITPKTKIEDEYMLKFNMNAPDYLQYYADAPDMIKKDELKIKISETDNKKEDFITTIETINLKEHYKKNEYDDFSFKDFSIDLSAYKGKNIYIAFEYSNEEGFGIGINTVDIGKKTSLSTQKVVSANPLVQIYPNPTTNYIHINNVENAIISLFNINGQQLLQQKISIENNSVRTEQLTSGIYLLKIDEGSAVSTIKIIKQ